MTSPKQFFDENGYYVAKGVFSKAELAHLTAEFDRIVDQLLNSGEEVQVRWGGGPIEKMGGKDTVFVHTHNVQSFSAAWLRAFQQEKFLNVAQEFLGPNIVLHHSKLFQKPAEKGAPFPTHQDWSYFPTVKDTMIAGVIYISEVTEDMGCFRVYPGSHKLGRLPQTSGQVDNEVLEKYPIDGALALTGEPGDVVFFHYFTLHGSMPNRSSKVRKSVLVQMHAGEDRVEDENRHPNAKLVLRGWNSAATRNTVNAVG
ncbi:MAG: phytanoyl-CoA dioxygenase family protein [Planctomycetota bacterium]